MSMMRLPESELVTKYRIMANILKADRNGPRSPKEYIIANHMSSVEKHDNLKVALIINYFVFIFH